jgi:L-threonylcarbamoyladenylate synthase
MADTEHEIETRCLPANDPTAIAEALRALRAGQVVVIPTDTVYGVACDLWQPQAIERLYWAKQRPERLPIPVLVSDLKHVLRVATHLPPIFARLATRFWPGALTLVVIRRPEVPEELGIGQSTVAVRMPNHLTTLSLIEAAGGALAVTSANITGRPAPSTAAQAMADLGGRVAIVLDGGECPGGVPSSIVALVSRPPVLLRQGSVAAELLRLELPDLVVAHPS